MGQALGRQLREVGLRARTPQCPHEAAGTSWRVGHPGTQCGPCAPLGASQGHRRDAVTMWPGWARVSSSPACGGAHQAELGHYPPPPWSPRRRGSRGKAGVPSCLPASGWSAEADLWEAHQDGGPYSFHPKLTLRETPWVLADLTGRVGSLLHRSRSRPGPGAGGRGVGRGWDSRSSS